jgi:hypothetical protein
MLRTSARQGRRKVTIQDLSRLPVSEVRNTSTEGFETPQQFNTRIRKEQEAAAAAAKAAAAEKTQRDAELAKNSVRAAGRQLQVEDLMTEASDVLIAHCPKSPMTAQNPTEYSEQMLAAIRKGLSGVTFDDAGKTKLMKVAGLNREHINLTDHRVWKILFDHMVELGVFEANGSLAKPKPAPVAAPQPVTEPVQPSRPSIDELLRTTSAESRTGHAILAEAVRLDVRDENYSAFFEFRDECKSLLFEILNQEECDALLRVMNARNLGKNVVKNWHTARVLASKAGHIRSRLLPDEQLAWDMDRGLVPTNTFAERQAFNRRVSELHGKTPLLG